MSITIENKIDFKTMSERRLTAYQNAFERAIADSVAEIQVRTDAGLDVDGTPFAPYSPEYAKKRARAGRSTTPNLLFTGRMMASITHTVRRIGNEIIGEIFFNSATEALKARGNQAIRNFFGLSSEQVQTITTKISEARDV